MIPLSLQYRTGLILLWTLLLTLAASPVRAQPAAVEGMFIPVDNPITEEVARRIKNVTSAAVQRHRDADPQQAGKGAALKIVLDFTPNGVPANSTAFGGCYDLTKHLLSFPDVTTIAFLHGEVSRHSVLPVLACKEVVMSSEAKLGPVVGGDDRPLDESEEAAYRLVFRNRSRIPAVVLKLTDPNMELLEARRRPGGDVWYIDSRRIAEEEKAGVGVKDVGGPPVVGKGPASYTPTQAKTFGLCQLVRETRQEVAEAYQIPAASLRENPLLDGPPVVWKVTLTGPVNMAMHESLRRRARHAIGGRDKKHANFIVVQLECGGGDLDAAYGIAKTLRSLKQDDRDAPVKTVAYVPGRAPDTAAIIAMGCNEIVLHKAAEFGDFSTFADPPGELPRRSRVAAAQQRRP
jgi:membrane-bound serine protease (ClpP class)